MSSNGYHDKIRKILAMLEGAKAEGEAKAANLALQRLLAKNNLTAEQVGALGSEDPSASIEEEPVYIGSNDVVWKRMLASAIAENLRCRVMLTAFPDKPRAKIIVFVGHAEDAAVASECYRLTLKVAQRCFKRYSKATATVPAAPSTDPAGFSTFPQSDPRRALVVLAYLGSNHGKVENPKPPMIPL